MAKKKKTNRELVEEQHSDWASGVQGLNVAELESMLLRFAKFRQEIKDFKEADEQLKEAKELVKQLSAPHNENLKSNEQKTKYLIMLIGEKGGNTSGTAK